MLDAVQRECAVGLKIEHLHPDIHRRGTAETDILDVPGGVYHRHGHIAVCLNARALSAVNGLGDLLVQPAVHHQLDGVGRQAAGVSLVGVVLLAGHSDDGLDVFIDRGDNGIKVDAAGEVRGNVVPSAELIVRLGVAPALERRGVGHGRNTGLRVGDSGNCTGVRVPVRAGHHSGGRERDAAVEDDAGLKRNVLLPRDGLSEVAFRDLRAYLAGEGEVAHGFLRPEQP